MGPKIGLVLAWLAVSSALAQGPQNASPAEQHLLDATNQVRSERGLQPLHWDPSLAYAARAHAELMVQQNQLSHRYSGEPDLTARAAQAGAHFQAIAENVAMGPGASAIQKQWMESEPHRNNILDAKMTSIGIAVVEKRGYLYAVEDFANGVASLTPDDVEQKIGALLKERGIAPTGPKRDARQTCEMQAGIAAFAPRSGGAVAGTGYEQAARSTGTENPKRTVPQCGDRSLHQQQS